MPIREPENVGDKRHAMMTISLTSNGSDANPSSSFIDFSMLLSAVMVGFAKLTAASTGFFAQIQFRQLPIVAGALIIRIECGTTRFIRTLSYIAETPASRLLCIDLTVPQPCSTMVCLIFMIPI